jgi:hypothetical protein
MKMVSKDLLALLWVGGWGVLGWEVWGAIRQTEVLADRVRSAGEAVNNALGGLTSALGGLAALPLFGSLFKLPPAQSPGDALIALSVSVRSDIAWVAIGAAVVVALPPVLYVVLTYVPWRWRGMKEMGSALVFVRGAIGRNQTEQAKALLAYRALARLSFSELMAVSTDPIGDIQGRRYDGLATAMLEEAGLNWTRLETGDSKRLEGMARKQLTARSEDERVA